MASVISLATFGYLQSTTLVAPGRPYNLAVRAGTNTSTVLTWNMGQLSSYFQVYRADSPTGTFSLVSPFSYGTIYQDRNLQPRYYWYYVRRVNSAGTGDPSNIAYGRPAQVSKRCGMTPQNRRPTDKVNRSQSLFFNDRQWQMFKHISRQMVEHVAKQQVYYYEMDQTTMSGRSKIYGQRKKKVWKKPKTLYGRVRRMPVRSDRKQYGYNSAYTIQVYFDKNYLDCNKVDVNFMVGNQIQWDHKSFSVKNVQLFDSVMGLSDYKMSVLVTAIYTQD